jgi:oxidase EvaA
MIKNLYIKNFNLFKKINKKINFKTTNLKKELFFESTKDWSIFFSLRQLRKIYKSRRKKEKSIIKIIPIINLKEWYVEKKTGNIFHKSKKFFQIQGIRIITSQRETQKQGWDQPIVTDVGSDGGILGLLRARFSGIPHYLCQFKLEPGNYGKIQISPTLQATNSNIKMVHEGRPPFFLDYFLRPNKNESKIIFKSWLTEEGGRFYLKKNLGILLETRREGHKIVLPNKDFIWLSLFQIKKLINESAWVNPHLRSLLSFY